MNSDRLLILHLLFLILASCSVNGMELEKPMEVKPVAVEIEVPKSEHQVQLSSSEGQSVFISYDAFLLSNTMKDMLDDLKIMTGTTIEDNFIIPTNIDTKSLKRIAGILEKKREAQEKKQPLEQEVLPIIDKLTSDETILFLKGIAYLGVPEEIFHYVLEHLNHLLITMTDLTTLESILTSSFSKEITKENGTEKYLSADLRKELAKNLIDTYKISFFNIFPFYLESRALEGYESAIWTLAFSPDGKWLATASEDGVGLWNVQNPREIKFLEGHTGARNTLAFSPDGKWLAIGLSDKTVRLWNVQNPKEVKVLEGHGERIQTLAFSRDGKWLATGSEDKTARLWNVQNAEEVKILTGHKRIIQTLAFSPDGKWLATGSWDKTACLWNLQNAEEVKILKGHKRTIITLAFSPDGKWLATGSHDNTVRLWNVQNPKEVKILQGHEGIVPTLAFSPDGKWLATGSYDKTARLWNVQNPEEVKILQGHEGVIETLAFSPDGKWLATGSEDKTARLWNVQNPQEFKVLKACEDSIIKLAFGPDGQRLATRSGEGIARLWTLNKIYELANKLDYPELILLVKFSQIGTKEVLSNEYFRNLYNSINDPELKTAINKYFGLQ